jgi:hypothetical protein
MNHDGAIQDRGKRKERGRVKRKKEEGGRKEGRMTEGGEEGRRER